VVLTFVASASALSLLAAGILTVATMRVVLLVYIRI